MTPVHIFMLLLAGPASPEGADSYELALAAAVHHFARAGEAEHLKAILEKHPRLIDAAEPFSPGRKPDSTEQSTPLHWAAQYGHLAVADYLIGRGAAVNSERGGGWKPLHLAARSGHLDVVKLLVTSGANVEAKTEEIPESSDPLPGAPPVDPAAPTPRPNTYPAIPARTALEWAIVAKEDAVVNYLRSLKRGTSR